MDTRILHRDISPGESYNMLYKAGATRLTMLAFDMLLAVRLSGQDMRQITG